MTEPDPVPSEPWSLEPGGSVPRRSQRRGGWWTRGAIVVVALAGLAWFVVADWSQIVEAARLLRDVSWAWLALGAVTSILSIVLFAAVRSTLLASGGAHLSLGRATAASFASGAIAASIPAGGAVATGYMVQRYREAGADGGLAGWTTIATGVVAPSVLVFLTLTGYAIAGDGSASVIVPSIVAIVLLGGFFHLTRRPELLRAPIERIVRSWYRVRRRADDDSRAATDRFIDQFGAVRAGPWRWAAVWLLQVLSWLGEYLALLAAIVAVGGQIPWTSVLAIYGTCQLAGAIPLVPGGAGQVEAALVVGLTAGGMEASTALAASLVFRIVSHWLVVPIGWVTFAALRRRTSPVST